MNLPAEQKGGQSRRAFCAYAGMALACTAVGALPLSAVPPDEPKAGATVQQTIETQASMAKGAIKDYRKRGGFFLVADDGGIYAVSSTCTHAGCTVYLEDGKAFACPCHDSGYDLAGTVTQGPAKLPLKHFEVSSAGPGAVLVVNPGKVVDAHARY